MRAATEAAVHRDWYTGRYGWDHRGGGTSSGDQHAVEVLI